MFQCHDDLFHNDTNYTHDDVRTALVHLEQEELLYKVPTFIYLSFLLLIGIPGNCIVCVVYHLKLPRSTPRRFIVALALFDLLNCLVGIPFEVADLITDYFLNIPTLCRLVRMSNTFSSSGSILILLIISVDRYRKICRPFRKQILVSDSKRWVYVITGLAGLISIPAVVFYGHHSLDIRGLKTFDCSFDDSFSDYMFPKLYQIGLALFCVMTIIVLIVLYTFIVLKIVKQKKRRATLTSGARQAAAARAVNASNRGTDTPNSDTLPSHTDSLPEMSDADKSSSIKDTKKKSNKFIRSSRMTLMMLAVTVVFIIGYMPHFGLQITRQILPDFTDALHCNHVGLVFYAFFLRSYFLNSAVNPIIYSFYNKRFRQECVTLLRRLVCVKSETETINTVTDSDS
ncbi:orexin receptor type 2-like [Haliotis rufescens]|uniref:orexin receptor type 2-like n=1 Tax=Haliotis rufescens TaxID=6454 RepID=UPI00201E9807|nr:orexin receptor type 2-like [Haliotis rufescens]